MKRKLFIYACSHGTMGTVANNVPNHAPHHFKNNDSFGDIIAKKLDLELINRSQPGSSNFSIFNTILNDLTSNAIDKQDICIVQWSHIDRAWSKSHTTLMPHIRNNSSEVYYSDLYNDVQNYATMIGYNLYVKNKLGSRVICSCADRIDNLIKISKFLTQDLISEIFIIDNKTPREFIENMSSNQKEILFPCWHASEIGHQIIADLYLTAIREKIEI